MVRQQSIGAVWLCCGCLYGARAGVQSSTVGLIFEPTDWPDRMSLQQMVHALPFDSVMHLLVGSREIGVTVAPKLPKILSTLILPVFRYCAVLHHMVVLSLKGVYCMLFHHM